MDQGVLVRPLPQGFLHQRLIAWVEEKNKNKNKNQIWESGHVASASDANSAKRNQI
jgi:hypothetical protein